MRIRLLLALPSIFCLVLPSFAADKTRKDNDRTEEPARFERYYRDEDGDGIGAGQVIFIPAGAPAGAGYVRTNSDCDDGNPRTVQFRPDLLRDCNGNAVAETATPEPVCVGEAEVFVWEDERGVLRAAFRYRDADGRLWIDAANARRNRDGTLLREESSDCGER
jgi:hypothetical protein